MSPAAPGLQVQTKPAPSLQPVQSIEASMASGSQSAGVCVWLGPHVGGPLSLLELDEEHPITTSSNAVIRPTNARLPHLPFIITTLVGS
jgi:hypothetical protein